MLERRPKAALFICGESAEKSAGPDILQTRRPLDSRPDRRTHCPGDAAGLNGELSLRALSPKGAGRDGMSLELVPPLRWSGETIGFFSGAADLPRKCKIFITFLITFSQHNLW